MRKRDLITFADLTDQEIEEIFYLAESMESYDRHGAEEKICCGKIMATLFYEPSTRTRLSFESAMQRLGGSVISCAEMRSSSAAKGESVADTARVISSYADLLVIRHYWDGAVQALAEHAEVPVINAGDGCHEHPTQTLCDLYTLKREKGRLKGLTVAISGDLKHGRTVHSLVYALARFGVHVIILAASGMELPQYVIERLDTEHHYSLVPIHSDNLHAVVTSTDAIYLTPSQPHQLALFTQPDPDIQNRLGKLASGLKLDAFYVTRQQKERVAEDESRREQNYPRIGERFLKERRFRDTLVMHPLPRVDELSHAVDKDRRGIYFKQAAYGVPIRMALLKLLLDGVRTVKPSTTRKEFPLYESPELVGPQCPNPNCVTRTETTSTCPSFDVLFPGSSLILRCLYCDHQVKAQFIGHEKSKRYCSYDPTLEETVREWLKSRELTIFDSIKQAEELGYEPYKTGPQRSIMDEDEIREAVQRMAAQILRDTGDSERLLVLGIRTKGIFIAERIAAELGKQQGREVEVAEIEIYGARQDGIRRPFHLDPDRSPLNIKDRPVILVDDVLHTGRTVKSALSIIFKSGRPQSVRLAVLIDRGHREVPVKPNYVGKHIPSSERERVRVKLREVEKDERDKVVIYSLINPTASC
ncbi:MAG: aspartate carbamoyltransferase [Candidatus Binatia bacterium]